MELDITWEESSTDQDQRTHLEALLEKGIAQALSEVRGSEKYEIGLLLVDNEAIRQLNKDYRKIDSPTDVLSFALQEKTEDEPDIYFDEDDAAVNDFSEEMENMLGDIVISLERAREQAAEYGHSLDREIVFLAVHGTLHLLGYDHDSEEQTRSMRDMEEKIMDKIGLMR